MTTAAGLEAARLDPPPWRNPRISRRTALRRDRAAGAAFDGLGRRTLVAPIGWLPAWRDALMQETGDAADEILTAIGAGWGAADMAAFIGRASDEFGDELVRIHMAVALQTWWWPFNAGGWGVARFDYGRSGQKWIRADVADSAWARAAGAARRPVCHLYAGLFAGALSRLTGRTLIGVETQCRACDGVDCRFLVTTDLRAAAIREWRRAGLHADEIESRLAGAGR